MRTKRLRFGLQWKRFVSLSVRKRLLIRIGIAETIERENKRQKGEKPFAGICKDDADAQHDPIKIVPGPPFEENERTDEEENSKGKSVTGELRHNRICDRRSAVIEYRIDDVLRHILSVTIPNA